MNSAKRPRPSPSARYPAGEVTRCTPGPTSRASASLIAAAAAMLTRVVLDLVPTPATADGRVSAQPGAAGPGGTSGCPGAPDAPPLSGTVLGTVNEAGGNSVSGPSGQVAGEPGTRSAGLGASELWPSAGRGAAPGASSEISPPATPLSPSLCPGASLETRSPKPVGCSVAGSASSRGVTASTTFRTASLAWSGST